MWPRSSVDQAQSHCSSGLEHCRICTQKKKFQHAEFCRSVAAEEASEFWILNYDRVFLSSIDFGALFGDPQITPQNKEKQGSVRVCGRT